MSKLFEPYDLAGLTLPNRVVMAPMTRSRARLAVADEQTALYYRQRASAGLIVTEGSQVSVEGRGYLHTPGMHTDEQVAGWRKVTDAVHCEGGRILAQLWHVGRISHVSLQERGEDPVSSVSRAAVDATAFAYDMSDVPAAVHVSRPRALTTFEIGRVVNDFVKAASNAMVAGFDGVEIHAANGYLFDQFLNGALNTRSDRYGGHPIDNHVRFVLETLDAVAFAIGSAKTGIRLSPFGRLHDMRPYSNEDETWFTLAEELSARKLAYVHLSDQRTLGKPGIQKRFLADFRQAYSGTLIQAGGFGKDEAADALNSGIADLIAFGKPFISNPDLVERLKDGSPLTPSDRSTFYGGDSNGYTDYPAFAGFTSSTNTSSSSPS